MPGTPPTSPRFGAPRYANADGSDFAGQTNGVTDVFDALGMRGESGLLSARPSTGLGIANRFYFATDNGRLYRDAGGATPTWSEVTPQAHAASHAAGGTDALTVTETMMATGATGLAKGAFNAFRNSALSLASLAVVVYDTDSGTIGYDVSNWYDTTTGRYTPQVAGYYDFHFGIGLSVALTIDAEMQPQMFLNGGQSFEGSSLTQRSGIGLVSVGSGQVKMNGTTDFVDVRLFHNNGGTVGLSLNPGATFFQGHFIGRS